MDRKHSWTWLPTRFTRLHPSRPPASLKSRPCLPILEQLEDRVLLSASTGGTDAILISLIKGELDLRTSQVSFIKDAQTLSNGSQAALDALSGILDNLSKIDLAVYKLTTDALTAVGNKADAPGQKFLEIKLQDLIISSFAAIDQKLGALGDGSVDKLLPAVQRLQDSTNTYVAGLSQLPAVQYKELGGLIKIQGDLLKIDVILDAAAKFQDIHVVKNTDKASTTLMLKLDTSFQKIDTDLVAAFGDGSVTQAIKGEVDALKIETEGILIGLLKPAPVGTPVTTALATTPTSDLIS